jgi:hypothetical protein
MTTTNDKGVDVCSIGPLRTNQNEHYDFATDAPGGKAFQTMRARAALAGFSLFETDRGFMLCRYDLVVAAPCLRCVDDVLATQKFGGAR